MWTWIHPTSTLPGVGTRNGVSWPFRATGLLRTSRHLWISEWPSANASDRADSSTASPSPPLGRQPRPLPRLPGPREAPLPRLPRLLPRARQAQAALPAPSPTPAEALHVWPDKDGVRRPPSDTPLGRAKVACDVRRRVAIIGRWLSEQEPAAIARLALDGKTPRGSGRRNGPLHRWLVPLRPRVYGRGTRSQERVPTGPDRPGRQPSRRAQPASQGQDRAPL